MTSDRLSTVTAIIEMWNGAPVDGLPKLIALDYRGHMLSLPDGERDAASYPGWIETYRRANPRVTFRIVEQLISGDRVVTRLEARRMPPTTDPAVLSRGINISRFDPEGRLAEEWAVWSAWLDEPSA